MLLAPGIAVGALGLRVVGVRVWASLSGAEPAFETIVADGPQKIAFVVLLQQLGQGHGGLGHRGLRGVRVEVGKLHLDRTPRWPPRLHRRNGQNFHHQRGR